MNFIEFIGFIVSLIALGILAVKKRKEEKLKQEDPEEYARQQAEHESRLRELFLELRREEDEEEEDEREEVVVKPTVPKWQPPPKPAQQQAFRSNLDDFQHHSTIANRKFETSLDSRFQAPIDSSYQRKKEQPSRIQGMIQKLPARQQMILMYEVFSPPKGL